MFNETYCGVEIAYNEKNNRWVFELRGRERSSESLIKAREAIDKPEPEKDKPAFARVQCYKSDYQQGWVVVEATSVAEASGYGGTPYLWTVGRGKDKARSKESANSLYPVNDHNTALIDELKTLNNSLKELHNRISEVQKQMQCLKV